MKIRKHPVPSIYISYKKSNNPENIVNNGMLHYRHMPDTSKTLIDIKKKEVQHKQNYKIKYKKPKRKILKILLHIFCLISQTES